jgi:hypothetical protein
MTVTILPSPRMCHYRRALRTIIPSLTTAHRMVFSCFTMHLTKPFVRYLAPRYQTSIRKLSFEGSRHVSALIRAFISAAESQSPSSSSVESEWKPVETLVAAEGRDDNDDDDDDDDNDDDNDDDDDEDEGQVMLLLLGGVTE